MMAVLERILKLFNCPPKDSTSDEDLLKCNADLQICNNTLKAAQQALAPMTKERDDLLALSKLLTEGPTPPDVSKMRWVSRSQIDVLMGVQLGAKYTGCSSRHFSESNYLVTTLDEMRRFIQYYAMFWMPHIKYVTRKWKKLDGSDVEIWMNDCDDYTNFVLGINALNALWACFPWGKIWAEVRGILMAGGHAFNTFVACDQTYMETGITGLKAYMLEPQMADAGPWPAARPKIIGYDPKELTEVAGFFEIVGTIWMVEF